jgi:GNAT superfamily N-acetyltransferase
MGRRDLGSPEEGTSEAGRPPAASAVRIEPMDPRCSAAQFCLQSYFTELAGRFDAGFDPAVSISATNGELTPPAGVLLIATLAADPIGCGALKFNSRAYAEIKRMWVSPTARGLGVGRRLLIALENLAAARGVRTVRLETNRALTEAIRLYRSSGYTEVQPFNQEPYAHHWFEKVLGPTRS